MFKNTGVEYVCVPHSPSGSTFGGQIPLEAELQIGVSLHLGYWALNPGFLKEQPVLLTMIHLSDPLFEALWLFWLLRHYDSELMVTLLTQCAGTTGLRLRV